VRGGAKGEGEADSPAEQGVPVRGLIPGPEIMT